MKQAITIFIVLVTIASALAMTGTNDQSNINITKGQISIAPINTVIGAFSIRGAGQYIAHIGNDTSIQARFGILAPDTAPESPSLLHPPNNSFLNYTSIEFKWTESEDQNNDTLTYLFELFNNTGFTLAYSRDDAVETGDNNVTNNVTIPEDITLYWRVLANDSLFNSSFSDEFTLTIDTTLPSEFNLTLPANNTQSKDTTPELVWGPTTETNLQNYTIEFCTTTDCGNATRVGTTTEASFSNWTVGGALDEATTYYWQVIATDKANNQRTSTLFIYNVQASQTITETTTVGGGGGETVGSTGTQLFSLSIISPPDITLVSDETITIPLTIKNPARLITLDGINLDIVSDSQDITAELGRVFIDRLSPKEETIVPLTLRAKGQPGAYGMTITATVSKPYFTDKVRILANLIEEGAAEKTQTSKQLDFAKDLIDGNPECLELREYVQQAEEALTTGNVDKALAILDSTISNCQKLISREESSFTTSITGSLFEISHLVRENQTALILTAESAAFFLTVFIVIKLIRKKRKK